MELSIAVASILCESALDEVFFVDISLTTPWLSRIIVICLVAGSKDRLASFRAWMKPTYSASKIPYSVLLPSCVVLKCLVFSHHAAAAVFLLSIREPSEYTIVCTSDGHRAAID